MSVITDKKAFTLIEIIIVIALIALMAAGIFVALNPAKRIGNAKDAVRAGDALAIEKAIQNSIADNLSIPSGLDGLAQDTYYMLVTDGGSISGTHDCATLDESIARSDVTSDFVNFIGEIPVDSDATGVDTGYYVKRTINHYECGHCNAYEDEYVDSWVCGDDVSFTYNGSPVTYGTVTNPTTSECWLDRNLGATQVALSSTDSDAYGDLFQWGRDDDGHQVRTSGTTSVNSSSDTPGHSDFILEPVSPEDWRDPQNDNLWQGLNGTNNPCPSGWRIPTETELDDERSSWSSNNSAGAFASPLKLTVVGYRSHSDGSLGNVGSYGYYWSSSVVGADSRYLVFNSSAAIVGSNRRADALAIRCLKD